MVYQRIWHVLQIISLLAILLLTSNTTPVNAWQAWTREQRRDEFPVDQMSKNLDSPKREKTIEPERVIDVFGVKKGDVVADVGAGTGYFSFRLASKVGIEGKVYALEIEDKLLDKMRHKMAKDHVKNILLEKPTESDPNLPVHSCDKILIVGTYYYFSDAISYMTKLRKALKPGGLVAIIDVDKAKAGEKRKDRAKLTTASVIVDEMKQAGYELRQSHDFLEQRFFLIFSAIK